MKGDVGMSVHEKERKQEDGYTKTQKESTRREIGSETTDNLSEDNPMKNAYCASAHVLILTHPYISVLNFVCLL